MAMVRPAGGGDGIVTTTAQRRKCAADFREGCAVTTNLIEPGELGRHRADPDWAIIDCRFELARPDWGEQAFAAAHIHNALYAHLDRDLSGPRTALTGRHPLPEVGALVATFGRWGIDDRVQVVAYVQGGAVAFAARLWWLLRWLGHGKVAVLDAGVAAGHNLLALGVAGLPGARLYAGSWSEWIRDPARPVARGPEAPAGAGAEAQAAAAPPNTRTS